MATQYLFSEEIGEEGRESVRSLVKDYIDEKGYNITTRRLFKGDSLESITAFENEKALGFINYCYKENKGLGRIEHAYVSREKRGEGIGTKLLETSIKDLACAGADRIITSPISSEGRLLLEKSDLEIEVYENGPFDGRKFYGTLETLPDSDQVLGKSAEKRMRRWRKNGESSSHK